MAAAALLLGITRVASASTTSSSTGWVRLAHLSPNTPAVDVYLYSFGDPSAELVLHHVSYGTVSPYEALAAGEYTVAMRAAGAAASTKPVLSASLTVAPGGAYTVAGLGPESGLRLEVLQDQLTAQPGKASVRFIQASLKQHAVTVTWDGKPTVTNLAFGSVSSYQAVSPATATLHVAGGSDSVSSTITLTAGTVHTVVVLDGPKGLVLDDLLDAAGSDGVPEGAAATGLGGTAPRVPSPLLWLSLIAAGLLLTMVGGLGVRLVPRHRGRHAR
ncbi:MAG: DUF4397 domain-containing protein [Trebonia sp.]|uniref:DUF4397 domain-containing protein n=1 Tax=Trebonia sp. TaxID=2767075 RepID=UPI003C783C1F